MGSRIPAELHSSSALEQFSNPASNSDIHYDCLFTDRCNHTTQVAQWHEARRARRFFEPFYNQAIHIGRGLVQSIFNQLLKRLAGGTTAVPGDLNLQPNDPSLDSQQV